MSGDLAFLPNERLAELIDIVQAHIVREQTASTLLAYLLTERQRRGVGPNMRGVLQRTYTERRVAPKLDLFALDLFADVPHKPKGLPDIL